jgi:membrane associated rhomboid family serine protease
MAEGTGAFFSTLASFVTYAFLHANFVHLAINGLGFLIFGTVVARRIGPLRFALFSLVTTVASALAHLVPNWGDATPVIGASGAISGYMGAAARFMFIDPRSVEAAARPVLPLWSRPVVIFTLVWTGANILFGATGLSLDGSNDLTAWMAHMGGYFTGLLFFPLFDQRRYWLS